jgi:hypothetical protein
MSVAEVIVVTVARNADQRLEGSNLLRKIKAAAKVPRMPYLIYRFKKRLELIAEDPMRV